MIEYPTVEPIDTPHTVRRLRQNTPQKPHLSMAWVLDSKTGKPAARWVVEPKDMTWSQSLASVA